MAQIILRVLQVIELITLMARPQVCAARLGIASREPVDDMVLKFLQEVGLITQRLLDHAVC